MGQPYPPAGGQKQYNERPLKVYGEQYVTAGQLPVGVVIDPVAGGQPLFSDGQPRAMLPSGPRVVAIGEWVISNRYTGAPVEVLSNEEFTERFGGSGAEIV